MRVFVEFQDADNSEQLNDPHGSSGSSGCSRLGGKLGDRRCGSGGKDDVADEVDVEDDGDGGDNVEEKEEREEVVLYDKGTEDDFNKEDN